MENKMFDIEQNKKQLESLRGKLEQLKDTMNITEIHKQLDLLEEKTLDPNFWKDQNSSSEVSGKIAELKERLNSFIKIENEIKETLDIFELIENESDNEVENEIINDIKKIEKEINLLEINTLFNEKYDKNNAIVTIHPGAGGTEAMDWAEMLYRMYSRWAESNNFKLEELDYLDGEEAGLKSVTFLVCGKYAYGYLKGEQGVHRLVRISPFDAGARRHTSFASVEVLPEIDDDQSVEIKPEDIKMDVFRSSGAGGQHINKTSSAVRLTHIPTGIVTTCQTQRSQFQNKDSAMKMLISKLVNLKEQEHKETINDLKGIQMKIEWGSQIRSYVFCPYTMVKDHRTNYEVGNVQKVMDGDLNDLIYAYLKMNKKKQ